MCGLIILLCVDSCSKVLLVFRPTHTHMQIGTSFQTMSKSSINMLLLVGLAAAAQVPSAARSMQYNTYVSGIERLDCESGAVSV